MTQEWNPTLYNDKHAFVYQFGESLVQLLNPQKNERILDLGCGSGQLTAQLNELSQEVIGMDKSAEMITDAKSKYTQIDFRVGDAADFSFDRKFDAIFSNATLHWVTGYEKAVKCMYENLNPGGRIVVEFGGKGNVQKMVSALRTALERRGYSENAAVNFWYFPSIGEYASVLENHGFRVLQAEHYDRPTPLSGADGMKDWFRMFGGDFFEGITKEEKEEILEEVQSNLWKEHFIDGIWYADYKRIRVVAVKEKI